MMFPAAMNAMHPGALMQDRGHSERLLVRRLRNGDPSAFEQVHREYKTRLHRAAYRILRNEHAAEDAVQEALIRAFLKVKFFDERSSFYTWLTKILTNMCLIELRKNRRRRNLSLDDVSEGTTSWADLLEAGGSRADDLIIEDEAASALSEVLKNLRPDQRFILLARSRDDLSFSEIAVQLGISLSAAKSRALRARQICARNVRLLLISRSFVQAQASARTLGSSSYQAPRPEARDMRIS